MNDIFQEKHSTPAVRSFTTVYDRQRAFNKCEATLWATAQPYLAFSKVGLGIGGWQCVCHLHDKVDDLNRSERTVKTALNELENAGLITRVRQGWNRANCIFLQLPDGVQISLPIEGNICPMEVQDSSPCMGQNLPTSNTDKNYTDISKTDKREIRHRYGQYQNVFLSEKQIAELEADYPDRYAAYIEKLSSYMEASGKHYANHYAAIRKWLDEDRKAKSTKNYDSEYTDKGDCL